MKVTSIILKKVFYAAAILLFLGAIQVSAQDQAEKNVIAISKDGVEHVAASTLRVAVFQLDASPMKFQVALENLTKGYVKIQLKDTKGNLVHRPIIVTEKKRVITFNTFQLKGGMYVVEIINSSELHRYQVQLGSKMMRSVEVKPGLVAKLKR